MFECDPYELYFKNLILIVLESQLTLFYLSKSQRSKLKKIFLVLIIFSDIFYFIYGSLRSPHFPQADTQMFCPKWMQLIVMPVVCMLLWISVTANIMQHIFVQRVNNNPETVFRLKIIVGNLNFKCFICGNSWALPTFWFWMLSKNKSLPV